MTGPLIIISLLIALGLGVVFYLKRQQPKVSYLVTEGIYFNYKILIDSLLQHDKRAVLADARSNSIRIQSSNARESSSFSITQVVERIIIVWTWTGSEFGPRGKEWSFAQTEDQEKTAGVIRDELNTYLTAIYKGHNKQMPQGIGQA